MSEALAYGVVVAGVVIWWGLDSIADGLKEIAKAMQKERAP